MTTSTRVVVFLVSLAAAGAAARGAVIEMKGEAEVDRNIIRLKDIARVHDALPEEAEALGAIYVTLSPAPGQVRTVALDEVRRRLRAHGVNLSGVILEGPVSARVRRGEGAGRPAPDPVAATDLVAKYVATALGRPADEVQVTLDGTDARSLARLAASGLRLAVEPSPTPIGLGHNGLVVTAYQGAEARERCPVSVEVKAYVSVPVAARSIARQRRLTPEDVTVERRLVGDPVVADLTPADLVGRLAARGIRQGAVIEPGMVVDVPVVRRGDAVTVIARVGPIEVKTVGVALEDGAARQTIKVRNVDTGKVFAAQVQEGRTVLLGVQAGGARR